MCIKGIHICAKRISKGMEKHTFILSDESVNEYGFRVLTAGIDLANFQKNPVMLYAHIRAYEERSKDGVMLPIGKWENIRVQGSQLLGDAVFDEDDDFAMKVAKKVSKGMLNTASVGLKTIEESEDPDLMLPGQTWPTITKSKLREVSIADIPGNANAVKLYGDSVTVSLGLSESNPQDLEKLFKKSSTKSNINMKKLIAKINKLGVKEITLTDSANEDEIAEAIDKVEQLYNKQLTDKDTEITNLTQERDKFKKEAEEAGVTALNDKAVALIDSAVNSGKCLASEKETLLSLAQSSEDGYKNVKTLLDGKQPHKSVSSQITKNTDGKTKKELAAEWDKLHADGELADVKLNDKERYAEMYEAKFDKKPAQD